MMMIIAIAVEILIYPCDSIATNDECVFAIE